MSLSVPFSSACCFPCLFPHSFQPLTEVQKQDPHPAAGASLDNGDRHVRTLLQLATAGGDEAAWTRTVERSRSSPLPEETKAMWSRRESDSSAPAARRSRVGVGPPWAKGRMKPRGPAEVDIRSLLPGAFTLLRRV
jgi:hypothetical protein